MVHFDASRASHHRLRLAADLAMRLQAALIGIAGRPYLPSFLADDIAVAADDSDAEQRELTALLADIGTKFRAEAERIKHVEWRGAVDDVNRLVAREARAADLVVVGRPADSADLYYSLDPGVTILRCGRPVLLVPDGVDVLASRRVVVAWKDSREARRAVQDALPLLQQAHESTIVEICEYGTEAQSQRRLEDVANYLRRQKVGVRATACLHTQRPVAQEIIRVARDEKADLIVAGGYGRSRLGEWMFGGVTRGLLAESPLCCLFSH
ncbi:MAG TPA: universal stress protein [Xanthobacteraceae bacterium]|jgi:nucleotide-binding universal stress UspA family protein